MGWVHYLVFNNSSLLGCGLARTTLISYVISIFFQNSIVLYLFELCVAHKKTKKSRIYMQDCNKTANAETSGLMGNPIIGLKSITSGDRFMSPRTKLKS